MTKATTIHDLRAAEAIEMAESARLPQSNREVFSVVEITRKTNLRWFLCRGAITHRDRGFRNKRDVRNWIESLGKRIDWRVGFVFRLKGDTCDMSFVDRNGKTSA